MQGLIGSGYATDGLRPSLLYSALSELFQINYKADELRQSRSVDTIHTQASPLNQVLIMLNYFADLLLFMNG